MNRINRYNNGYKGNIGHVLPFSHFLQLRKCKFETWKQEMCDFMAETLIIGHVWLAWWHTYVTEWCCLISMNGMGKSLCVPVDTFWSYSFILVYVGIPVPTIKMLTYQDQFFETGRHKNDKTRLPISQGEDQDVIDESCPSIAPWYC